MMEAFDHISISDGEDLSKGDGKEGKAQLPTKGLSARSPREIHVVMWFDVPKIDVVCPCGQEKERA